MNTKPSRIAFTTQRFDTPIECLHQGWSKLTTWLLIYSRGDVICQQAGDTFAVNRCTTNNRYGQRCCLEVWHINMNHHALNRDDGIVIYHKSISILLANDVTSWIYKKPRCDFRSPLMHEDTRLECWNVGSWMQFDWALHSVLSTRVASETWLILYLVVVNVQTLYLNYVYVYFG